MSDGERELDPQEEIASGLAEQSPGETPDERAARRTEGGSAEGEPDGRSSDEETSRQAMNGDETDAAGAEVEHDEVLKSSYERATGSAAQSEKRAPDMGTDPTAKDASQRASRDSNRAGRDIHFVGRDSVRAGRDVNYYGATVEEPEFNEVPSETVARLHAIFVEPSGYRGALGVGLGVHQVQVFLVYGADHSGKWTSAVNLARELSENRQSGTSEDILRVYQYSRPTSSEVSLAEAMRSDDLPESAVVLVKDCFERNVRPEELEAAELEELLVPLRKKNSILILTGDLAREHLEALAVVKLAAHVAQLRKVLVKHLEYGVRYEGLPLREEQVEPVVNRWWNRLKPHLATPFHISQFCSKLAQVLSDAKEERSLDKVLLPVARAVAIGGSQASRSWFDALHPNEKLFSLLVYLFDGAERRWLEELGRQLVRRFRDVRFEWFSDPREQGLEDARERIQAIEQGGRLEFEDRLYEREVRWQIENRQHLLWDALEFLVGLDPLGAWAEGWKRQALGVALGRLGIHDHARLEATLQDMAADSDKLRAVVPGYALQEIVRGELGTGSHFAIQLLAAWIRSRNHRIMWAAAAALWRVYLALRNTDGDGQKRPVKDQIFRLLRQLGTSLNSFELIEQEGESREDRKSAGSSDEALRRRRRQRIWGMNFLCVVEAMRRITLADPELAAPEVAQWILRGSDSQPDLGRRTVRVVYETFATAQYKPSEAQEAPLLSLLSPLLEKASDESLDVETVFLTLRSWLRWPGLGQRVRAKLLYIATYSGSQPRERLRSIVSKLWLDPRPMGAERAALQLIQSNRKGQRKGNDHRERQEVERLVSFWCRGTEEPAHRIAQAVAVRCYAVGGALPSLPGMGCGVVVVDPELLAAKPDSAEASSSSIWSLLALLESRLELTLLRLGQTEPVDLFGSSLSAIELLPRFAGHRLLMPGLEAVQPSQRESVFVLAPRKPHDFDDLPGQPWLRNLHYLGPSSEREKVSEAGYVHLDLVWPPSPKDFEGAVSALEGYWARALASASGELWLELIRAFGIEEGADYAALLQAWAQDLDGPSTSSGPHEDPVWKSLALSLWLAATDLRACLAWIGSWLTLPDEALEARAKRAIGAAAAFALIRLYTAYPPEDAGTGRASPLLFELLAQPLGRHSPDGVDALFRFVNHWLVDPVWAEYLTGDVQEGRGRLERWAGEFLHDRPELASKLAERVAASRPAEGTAESWEALAAVVDRVKARRALEKPSSLPDIRPDQRYALLVIGTGSGNEDLRRHLAAVTANLYGELLNNGSLVPVIYRLGERRPFWAGSPESPVPERLLPRGMRLSGLVGPLFKMLEGKRDQVSMVLLITAASPIDLDDWVKSAWWSKVRLYGEAPVLVASFASLPKPTALAASTNAARFEAERVADFLSSLESLGASNEPVPIEV